ncbi:hypothetical protein CHGG_02759 [Chaetomium globosum CBS 148.51]|uniref:Uncharacterized protein n=1 Tax=Chaetomium globosum (strain ATCC 6205 / CBS 148.51 / DSM 1962 / NBRC 6347 / NRRL 1970) TaxID=306901 RepID=Q2HAJ5_CHAGB|nr:uncharacterized protein CHGG_02759 [Chaetomium globosum CBS 148.51]EAQ90824.1 hypothetical protein CHGG_02759 [Chaetomium globosum CBS 148.51]
MTGKQLSDDHRAILSKLLQIPKLTNREISWVLGVDDRTVRRRRIEFEATGEIKKHKDVSKNAEKLKPQHMEVPLPDISSYIRPSCQLLTLCCFGLQKLVAWHKDHPDALLDDMQMFLRLQCGLEVSRPTISRQIRKAYGGTFRRSGRCARIRSRKQREAEGRSIALELQQQNCGADNSDQSYEAASSDLFYDQRQLAPLGQALGPPQEPARQEEEPAYQAGDGQQHPARQCQLAEWKGARRLVDHGCSDCGYQRPSTSSTAAVSSHQDHLGRIRSKPPVCQSQKRLPQSANGMSELHQQVQDCRCDWPLSVSLGATHGTQWDG